jgi:Mg/Co/Ni transporter MgtE
LLFAVTSERAAQLIEEFPHSVSADLIEQMPAPDVAPILEEMASNYP